MKVKIIDENQLTRPYISKKAMHHIIARKDKYIKERDVRLASLQREEEQWIVLAEEEKIVINKLKADLKVQKQITYFVGVVTSFIGGLVGFMLNG